MTLVPKQSGGWIPWLSAGAAGFVLGALLFPGGDHRPEPDPATAGSASSGPATPSPASLDLVQWLESDATAFDGPETRTGDMVPSGLVHTSGAMGSRSAHSSPVYIVPEGLARRIETILEPEIRRALREGQIPSLTIALVHADTVLWAAGYGTANRATGTRATPETVYALASTFKTLVGATLLQLQEIGALRLDDPVAAYLPAGMQIQGEDPSRPVTFLHLLTHTSGLPAGFTPVPFFDPALPMPLERYLAGALRIEGRTGGQVRYSNPGYALLGYLVEQITGVPFEERIRTGILSPLGLRDVALHPTPSMTERLAIPYQPAPDGSGLRPVEWIRFAEWPAGAAFGTVLDQAVWLGTVLNGGAWRGVRVLSPESMALALDRPFPQFTGALGGGWGDARNGSATGYGLTWWITEHEEERYLAHSGSLRGFTAFLHGNVDRRIGVALLTNGDRAHPHLVRISFLATDLLRDWLSEPASDI